MHRWWTKPFFLIQVAATMVCFFAEGVCRFLLHLRYPYDCPVLVDPGDFFPDFTQLIDRLFVNFHTMAFFQAGDHHFMYPPAAALLYEPFALIPRHRVVVYVAVLLLTFLVSAALFARALVLSGVICKPVAMTVAGVLLSYPLWFEIQRGNVELLLWGLMALGVWAFYRGRGYSAAACFGLAGSMKLYPAVYLGLLIARRQYRQVLFAVLIAALVTVASLWLIYPNVGISMRETMVGLHTFDFAYVQHGYVSVISFDHSLFALYKRLAQPSFTQLIWASKLYLPVMALTGLVLFFGRIRTLPLANQVLALTIAMILFPPVSFDYTLLHLYVPLCMMLVTLPRTGDLPRGVRAALPLYALLLSPLTEFIRHGQPLEGQLKALLLVCLLIVSMILPVASQDVDAVSSKRGREGQALPVMS